MKPKKLLNEDSIQTFDDINLRKGRETKPYYPNKGTYKWTDPRTKKDFIITFSREGIEDIKPTIQGSNRMAFNDDEAKRLFNQRNSSLISSVLGGLNTRKPTQVSYGSDSDERSEWDMMNYEPPVDGVHDTRRPWNNHKLEENKSMKKTKLKDLIKENFLVGGDNLTKNSPSHAFAPKQTVKEESEPYVLVVQAEDGEHVEEFPSMEQAVAKAKEYAPNFNVISTEDGPGGVGYSEYGQRVYVEPLEVYKSGQEDMESEYYDDRDPTGQDDPNDNVGYEKDPIRPQYENKLPDPSKWGQPKLKESKSMKKDKNLLNERMLGLAGIVPLQSIGFATNSPAQSVNEWEEEDLSQYDADLTALEDPRAKKTSRVGKFGKDSWDDERYDKEELPDEWIGGPPDELSENLDMSKVEDIEIVEIYNKLDAYTAEVEIEFTIDGKRYTASATANNAGGGSWELDHGDWEDITPLESLQEDDFTPQNFPKEEANKNADMTQEYMRELNGPVPVAKQGVDGYEFEVYFQNGEIDDVEVVSGDFVPNIAMTRQLLDQGLSLGDALLSSKGRMQTNESRVGKQHGKNLISERAMGMLGMVSLQPIGIVSNANLKPTNKLREVKSDLSRQELYRYLPMMHSSQLMELAEKLLERSGGQQWDVIVEDLATEYINNPMAKKEISKALHRTGII